MKKLAWLLIILLLSSCSSTGTKPMEKLYYRFGHANVSQSNDINININKPSALGIIGNRPMVAQKSDGALKQMNNSFWLDSPKTLLYLYLKDAFHQTDQNLVVNDKTVYTQILHMEKKANTSIVAINFQVKNEHNKVLFDKTYKLEKNLSENEISTFVKSIQESLQEIIQNFATDYL